MTFLEAPKEKNISINIVEKFITFDHFKSMLREGGSSVDKSSLGATASKACKGFLGELSSTDSHNRVFHGCNTIVCTNTITHTYLNNRCLSTNLTTEY